MIKTKIEFTNPNRKYPYLGIDRETGLVVLFVEKDTGTLVHDSEIKNPSDKNRIGHYSQIWHENEFEYFNGNLVLSNQKE